MVEIYFLQRSQFLVGGECLRWNIVQLVSGQVSENNKISIILWSQILTVAYKTYILFNCFAVWKAFCLISVILLFSSLLQTWNFFRIIFKRKLTVPQCLAADQKAPESVPGCDSPPLLINHRSSNSEVVIETHLENIYTTLDIYWLSYKLNQQSHPRLQHHLFR